MRFNDDEDGYDGDGCIFGSINCGSDGNSRVGVDTDDDGDGVQAVMVIVLVMDTVSDGGDAGYGNPMVLLVNRHGFIRHF